MQSFATELWHSLGEVMVRLSLLLLLELQSVLGVSPPVQTVDIVRFDPLENTAFTEVGNKSC